MSVLLKIIIFLFQSSQSSSQKVKSKKGFKNWITYSYVLRVQKSKQNFVHQINRDYQQKCVMITSIWSSWFWKNWFFFLIEILTCLVPSDQKKTKNQKKNIFWRLNGIHVLIGTTFLLICLFRHLNFQKPWFSELNQNFLSPAYILFFDVTTNFHCL